MNKRLVIDEDRGELVIDGHRHVAIEIGAFLDYLDSLIGTRIAEVVINNLESRLGREDCQRIRKEKPHASIREVVSDLIEMDRVSGIGVTGIVFSEAASDEILSEIRNPCVTKTTGGAKSFLSSYYCGALSFLIGKELEVRDLVYDSRANVRRFRLVPRGTA